ncbi:MAG: hypothetical protein ABIP89_11830 [Polyangiaceae bacterium]
MGSRNVRSVVTGFAVVAIALSGCAVETSPNEPKVAVSQEALSAAASQQQTQPTCGKQNSHNVKAHRHTAGSGESGYTRPFPNHIGNATIDTYEQSVWNIPHTNGYEYLVDNTFYVGGCTPGIYVACVPMAVSAQVYLVGIADQYSSWRSSPPDPAAVRQYWNIPFSEQSSFWATPYDYATEVDLSTKSTNVAPNNAPLNAWHTTCIGVTDENGNILDYFVLADIHDPNGHNW